MAALLLDSFIYILEPEHLNILHEQKILSIILLSLYFVMWIFQTILYLDILANLPLLLNMVCIL